jgi:DNA-binding LytR/AlgR family response regulator
MTTLNVAGLENPIAIESITWIQGDRNYARIYFSNRPTYLVTQTLKWFDEQLPSFVRIHKSALINPLYVIGFEQEISRAAQVLLRTGHRLPVSRRRIDAVRTELGISPFNSFKFGTLQHDKEP